MASHTTAAVNTEIARERTSFTMNFASTKLVNAAPAGPIRSSRSPIGSTFRHGMADSGPIDRPHGKTPMRSGRRASRPADPPLACVFNAWQIVRRSTSELLAEASADDPAEASPGRNLGSLQDPYAAGVGSALIFMSPWGSGTGLNPRVFEVVMIVLSSAAPLKTMNRALRLRRAPVWVAAALWLAAVAVLFASWLAASSERANANCESFGRAGERCSPTLANGAPGECEILGRGGRRCDDRP